jgi:hypothetical protein
MGRRLDGGSRRPTFEIQSEFFRKESTRNREFGESGRALAAGAAGKLLFLPPKICNFLLGGA